MGHIEKTLSDMQKVRDFIAAKEAEIKEAKEFLRLTAAKGLSAATSQDEKLELAAQLYWFHEDIPMAIVYAAINTNAYKVQEILPPIYIEVSCRDCDNLVEISPRSRNQLKDLRQKGWRAPHCSACEARRAKRDDDFRSKFEQEKAEKEANVTALKSMPYPEYLQTNHWKTIRSKMLKRASFSCQLCNAKGVLNVHHRTYERRGCEEYSDLIVLCKPCHAKFHDKLESVS